MKKGLSFRCFKGRYFPFLLGNGIDCVLIDYSGSMSCKSVHLHLEQHQGTICAWYKATHRDYGKPLLPILQSDYTLIAAGGETYEVGEFSQEFAPKRAVLTTLVEATEFKLKIETFLTKKHVLVEHYTLIKMPEDKPFIALNLHPPIIHWSNSFYTFSERGNYKFSYNHKKRIIEANYELYGIKGKGILYTDFPQVSVENFYDGQRFILTNLKKDKTFTKYLLILDEKDTPNYKKDAERILNEIKEKGYKEILKEHEEEWQEYQKKSYINLPDKDLEYLYYLSLYLIRAHQNPKTGLISIGNYPVLWSGGVTNTWDLFFPHKALLGSNRVKEAESLICGYKKIFSRARNYAKEFDTEGAYFPWFMNYEGKSLNFVHPMEKPEIEKFNNGCLVMQVWDQYLYTGDKRVLERYWDLIKETTDFLISSVVSEKKSIAEIKKGEGADESISRENDTSHLLTTIKAIESLIEASKILNKDIDSSYKRIFEKLKMGLKQNYKGKILLPYKGAKRINAGVFTHYLFNLPEGIPKEGIEKALKECRGKLGLTNPGPEQNLIWPWTENRTSIVLAYLKDKRAFKHLYNATKYTSSLGAFPEKIRPDWFPINYWYVTCHGSYVLALNSMLVHSKGDIIRILPGVPDSWKDVEFENLRVPPGILVSLKIRRDSIKSLILNNDTEREIKVYLEIPSKYQKFSLKEPLLLSPYEKRRII